jgi:ribosomal RNA-processing protein 9
LQKHTPRNEKPAKQRKLANDEEIDSDDETVVGRINPETGNGALNSENDRELRRLEEDDYEETEQEKKVRVAKDYLDEIRDIHRQQDEEEQLDHQAINARLKEDVLRKLGTLYTKIGDTYKGVDESGRKVLKNAHKLSITCLIVSSDSKFVYSASKCARIVKWDLSSGKRVLTKVGAKKSATEDQSLHSSTINALAITTDGKYLASGSDDKLIYIWNPNTLEFVHKFKGHSGAVTGLVFRKHDHTLYSISKDRSLRVWDLGTMCYMLTLYGHQETITSIDMLLKERAVTSGGYDSSIRLWKVAEESQLIFNGKGESIDCVRYLDENRFVSGSMDGSIGLWNSQKKRPSFVLQKAHGSDERSDTANWIISVATLPFSDVFASGSNDGFVRVWKIENDKFKQVLEIPQVFFA